MCRYYRTPYEKLGQQEQIETAAEGYLVAQCLQWEQNYKASVNALRHCEILTMENPASYAVEELTRRSEIVMYTFNRYEAAREALQGYQRWVTEKE